jgi:predicted N-acetyltransferase YhbS
MVNFTHLYHRFGFSAELAQRFTSPYSNFGSHWMAVELYSDALDGLSGEIIYSEPFQKLS